MKTKIFAISTILLFSVMGLTAQDTWNCGVPGNESSVTATFDGSTSTLTISGTGAMKDYATPYATPWSGFGVDGKNVNFNKVVIEEGVTHIGRYAFSSRNSFSQAIIAKSVTSIGIRAFYNNVLFTVVTFAANSELDTIESEAFGACGIKQIDLPEGLKSIGEGAFRWSSLQMPLTLPNSLTFLGESAFERTALPSIASFGGLQIVPRNAFADNDYLLTVTLSDNITTLQGGAFYGCKILSSVTFGKNFSTFDEEAFSGSPISAYNVVESNTTFASNAGVLFSKDMKTLKRCPLKKTGAYTIPDGVERIDDMAFAYCEDIVSVNFPSSLRTIGELAFAECYELVVVNLGKDITTIGDGAFGGCIKLEEINVAAGGGSYASTDGVLFNANKKNLVQYPAGKKGGYSIPSGVETINTYAFAVCMELSAVSIPNSVKTIGYGAFIGCINLTSVALPEGLTSLAGEAFSDCEKLKSVNIPIGLKVLNDWVFSGCAITEISIPANIESIGESAFAHCYSLESVTFAESLQSIGEHAFANCSLSDSLKLPTGLKTLGNYAFSNNFRLASVTFPEGLRTIGEGAFSSNYNLSIVNFSEGLDTIGANAFNGVPLYGHEHLVFPEGLKMIGSGAFSGPSFSPTSVTLPASLTRVEDFAFGGGQYLTKITSLNPQPPILAENSALGWNYELRIEVPASALETYKTAPVWENFTNLVAIGAPMSWNCGYDYPNAIVATLYGDSLHIEGSGAMADFSYTSPYRGPWAEMSDSIRVVVIGDGITSVSYQAFPGHQNLSSVSFGNDIEYIGNYAFPDCPKLTAIDLPANIQSVASSAFLGCTSLTHINMKAGETGTYTSIDGVLFSDSYELSIYPPGRKGAYIVPDGIRSIGNEAFAGNTHLTDIQFPTSLTTIYDAAFNGCTGLTSLKLPEMFEYIGSYAFGECTGLTTVTLPATVYTINLSAFYRCAGLKEFTNQNSMPIDICFEDVFGYVNTNACKLKVPVGAKEAYMDACVWQDFDIEEFIYCDVNFNSNEGSAVSPILGWISGNVIPQPENPTREGYTFAGWYADQGLSTLWNFPAHTISSDTTLYAKWIDNSVQTYTVMFNSQGGTEMTSLLGVEANSLISAPTPDPTRPGYIFKGWFKDLNGTNTWNFATDRVGANITLYAEWEMQTFFVAFNTTGGSLVDTIKEVPFNTLVKEPESPTRENYEFSDWSKTDPTETSPEWFNFYGDKITENTTLYAVWYLNIYEVSFNTHGGYPEYYPEYIYHNGLLPQPDPDPIREGHTFEGWYKDAEYTSLWDFETDRVTSDTVLHAKWIVNKYTVQFESNDGTEVSPFTDVAHGTTIAQPATNPIKTNFTFEGWYKDISLIDKWNFATDRVYGDITLYAKWIDASINTYTVTFNSQGGSVLAQITGVMPNAKISAPADPVKDDNTFGGWYKEANCVNRWIFSYDTVSANTTLYAKWIPATYDVLFESQGGTPVSPIIGVSYGATISAPVAPMRNDYVFDGWYKEVNCENAWNFASDVVLANTTLYAKWTTSVVPMFIVNISQSTGGSISVKQGSTTLSSGASVERETSLTLNATVDAGYTFGKWWDDNTNANRSYVVNANVNISAIFTPVAVTNVTLNKSITYILIGNTETLTHTVLPANALNSNVTWSSNNDAVATVSNGVITAVSEGTATITVKTEDGNKTATCTVNVSATATAVTGVTLNKTSETLNVGGTITLTATITPSNATNQNMSWSSSNDAVASVSNGFVTALSAGKATIVVTTLDGEKTDSCVITVTSPNAIRNLETENALVLYPNPVTNGLLTIENGQLFTNSDPLSIKIYDLNGKCVHLAKPNCQLSIVNSSLTIDISHLPAGMYIVKIGDRSAKVLKR